MARLLVTFSGATAAGLVSIASLKAGDAVLMVLANAADATLAIPLGYDLSGGFSKLVLTDGELLQTAATDYSTLSLSALIEREAML
jgi:hypothetical protein